MRFFDPLPAAAAIMFGLALLSTPALGQIKYALEDDADKPAWQESEISLPPAPDSGNLLDVDVGAATPLDFAVDAKSITIGSDSVVRYTIVVTSRSGARTVNYEGIRCDTFERRIYAFGHKDGSWARSPKGSWHRIPRATRNGYAEALALDYFCEGKKPAGSATDIVDRVRAKRVLNPRIEH